MAVTLRNLSLACVGLGIAGILVSLNAYRWGVGDVAFGPIEQVAVALGAATIVLGAALSTPPMRRYFLARELQGYRPVVRVLLGAAALLALVPPAYMALVEGVPGYPAMVLWMVTVPVLAAAFFLAMLLLPRTLRINLVVLLGLVVASEALFLVIRQRAAPSEPPAELRTGSYYDGTYFVKDADLGFRLRPGNVATSSLAHDGRIIYDVTYTINGDGWRATPHPEPATARESFVAVFGDSFAFGEGVNDDETLPARLAALAPGHRVYNFGVHGYGPQQMLALLESAEVERVVKGRRGFAIFLMINSHTDRLVGNMATHNAWGHHMPYYRLEDGRVVRDGNFTSGRPLLAFLFPLLGRSQTLRFFGIDLPSPTSEHAHRLAAKVFDESCREFAARFESLGCAVAISPTDRRAARIVPYLEGTRARALDYSGLYADGAITPYFIEGDGHPSPLGHQALAERIVQDLRL